MKSSYGKKDRLVPVIILWMSRINFMEPEIRKLLPPTAKTYEKTTFPCTGADNFAADLTSTRRKQAILVGMEAHVCVLQTALDLYNRGYVFFLW